MATTAWHAQIWAEVQDALREYFEDPSKGFEVHANTNAQTITIIHRPSNKAFTVTPAYRV